MYKLTEKEFNNLLNRNNIGGVRNVAEGNQYVFIPSFESREIDSNTGKEFKYYYPCIVMCESVIINVDKNQIDAEFKVLMAPTFTKQSLLNDFMISHISVYIDHFEVGETFSYSGKIYISLNKKKKGSSVSRKLKMSYRDLYSIGAGEKIYKLLEKYSI